MPYNHAILINSPKLEFAGLASSRAAEDLLLELALAHPAPMQQALHHLEIRTQGQGFTRLNSQLNQWIAATDINLGVLHLSCLHTSASLTINENADPRVLDDLATWMDALVPQDGYGPANGLGHRVRYAHDDEGDDDMPAHIRTALTSQTLSLSVEHGRLLVGVWQGIYLWEHRAIPHQRRIACHLIGEARAPGRSGSG